MMIDRLNDSENKQNNIQRRAVPRFIDGMCLYLGREFIALVRPSVKVKTIFSVSSAAVGMSRTGGFFHQDQGNFQSSEYIKRATCQSTQLFRSFEYFIAKILVPMSTFVERHQSVT
jgi:hypothetical protein